MSVIDFVAILPYYVGLCVGVVTALDVALDRGGG